MLSCRHAMPRTKITVNYIRSCPNQCAASILSAFDHNTAFMLISQVVYCHVHIFFIWSEQYSQV